MKTMHFIIKIHILYLTEKETEIAFKLFKAFIDYISVGFGSFLNFLSFRKGLSDLKGASSTSILSCGFLWNETVTGKR